MEFKYYDVLTQLVVGYLVLVALLYAFGITYNDAYTVPYLAGAFVIGYFINAMSSLLENFYYWTIGGKPSDKLLQIDSEKKYTGISKVRFYHADEIIPMLKQEVRDENANERKMFSVAMHFSSSDNNTRVPDFNAHYAFSRVILTAVLVVAIILLIRFYNQWKTYLLFIPLLLSWERYKERGYYYAREVLNEYLNKKKQ
jgi:hypothetical protein